MTKQWRDLRKIGQDKFFERVKHYDCFANVDFQSVRCIAAPFGGPVALSRFASAYKNLDEPILPTIDIFTASGTKLGTINASEFHPDIVTLGWNDEEDLVIILKNGPIHFYSLFGELKKKSPIPDEIKHDGGILEAKIWGTGFVCYTKKRNFCPVIDNCFYHFGGKNVNSGQPLCWTIIEPELTLEKRSVEILLANPEGTITVLTEKNYNDVSITQNRGPFLKMMVSPSGKLLACYTHKHEVWIVQVDFAKEYTLFDTRASKPPDQFEWCGEAAIVCYWRTELNSVLLIIGLSAEYSFYQDPDPIQISSECDGLRIFSSNGCEFLYSVPSQIMRVFNQNKQGVENPAAKLYRASHLFHKEKTCVEDIMKDIKIASLPQAVDLITEAAVYEFDVPIQQDLLTSAAFGISFLDSNILKTSDIVKFKDMSKTIRVLNAMRSSEIGIPLSYEQYLVLTPQLLIDRLIGRDQHMLAFEICQYLSLPTDKVLIRWAKKKVLTHPTGKTEEDIAIAIKERIQKATGVSFASIAYEAYKVGREELATMLLDAEPRAADQVPLLVHMRKYEMALDKAIKSGDTNLIHLVLSVFRDDTEHGMGNVIDFENILRRLKPAKAIWTQICKEINPDYLLKMLGKEKMPMEIARIELQKAYTSSKPDEVIPNQLKLVGDILKKSSAHPVEAKLTEDELALLLVQKELETTLGGTFVGSSLTNTLYRCILMGAGKRAKKIRADFKVPNKRWWWIKIRALAETGRWEALRSFADPTKQRSPIGYKPFADVCFQNGNNSEAKYYLQFMPNDESKVMFYVQLQAWREVFDTVETLDFPEETLIKIRNKVKDQRIINQIDEHIAKHQTQGNPFE